MIRNKLISLFMFIIAFYFLSCASMEKEWKKTKESNTVKDYQIFIQKYPESKYSQSAMMEIDWKKIRESNSIEEVEEFLSKGYNLPWEYKQISKFKLAELECLNNALKQRDLNLYIEYCDLVDKNFYQDEETSKAVFLDSLWALIHPPNTTLKEMLDFLSILKYSLNKDTISNEIFWDLSLKKISIKNREKYTNLVKVTLPMVLIVWKNNLRNLNSLQALWDSETAFNNEIKYWDFYDNSTLTDSSFPYKMTELKNEFSENWFRVAKASDDHISYLEYLFYLYSNKISSDVRKREVYNLALTKLCEYVESNRNDDISFFWYYFNLFNGNKMVKLDHWKYIKSNYAVGFPFHINPKNIYDEFLKRFRIAKIELELAGKIEGFQQKDENITIPKIKKYFIDNLHSSLSELDLLDKTGQVGLRLSLNIEPTNWVTINKNDPFIGVIDRPPSTIYSIQPVLFGTATFYSLFSGNKLFEYQFGYGKTNLIRASTNQWDVIKREIKLTIFDLLILMSKDGISPKQTLKMLEKHKNLFISDEGNQLEIEIQEVVEIINGKTSFPVSKDTEPIVFPSSVEYKEPISWLFQKIQNRRLHIPTKSIDADQ